MRRTLLAVGIVVVVSMLFAPHVGDFVVYSGGWHPPNVADNWFAHLTQGYHTIWWHGPVYYWRWWPIFWGDTSDVEWRDFWIQTAFFAVLAAVAVNLRKSWRRNQKPPPAEKPRPE